jgi:RNA recognition motif-containing protein
MTIYVSNLNLNIIESDLRKLFARFGDVNSVSIKKDQYNGRSRGTAVIDMPVEKEAKEAISCLDNLSLLGKKIFVAEAKDHMKLMNF